MEEPVPLVELWQVTCSLSPADIALMLTSTAVGYLFPIGLVLLYAAGVRRKNALTASIHGFTAIIIGSLIWFAFGYSITFGPSLDDSEFIGTPEWAFLAHPLMPLCHASAPTIPTPLFVVFQMLYAISAVALITGIWAEKMKFSVLVAFSVTWPLLVYSFVAYWIWNPNGWIARRYAALDYGGGLVVFTAAGTAALVCAIALPGRAPGSREPHNTPLHLTGGFLALVGAYAMIAGGAQGALTHASTALLGTHMAAAGGAVVYALLARALERRWHARELLHGALAGVAAASAGAGYCAAYASLVVGILASMAAFLFRRFARDVIWLDDAFGITGTFGIGGLVGSFLLAFVADVNHGSPIDGLFRDPEQGGDLLLAQFIAILCTVAWSGVMTGILMFVFKKAFKSLDLLEKANTIGLDLVELGECAYDAAPENKREMSPQQLTAKLIHYAASGNVADLQRLIEAGVSPNSVDFDFRTAAHFAAYQGHTDVLQELHKHHVDLDAKDNYGSTPLHAALAHGHRETAQWLVNNGATPIGVGTAVPQPIQVVDRTQLKPANVKDSAEKAKDSDKTKKDGKKDSKEDAKKAEEPKKSDSKKSDATKKAAAKKEESSDEDTETEESEYEYEYEYVEQTDSEPEPETKKDKKSKK